MSSVLRTPFQFPVSLAPPRKKPGNELCSHVGTVSRTARLAEPALHARFPALRLLLLSWRSTRDLTARIKVASPFEGLGGGRPCKAAGGQRGRRSVDVEQSHFSVTSPRCSLCAK